MLKKHIKSLVRANLGIISWNLSTHDILYVMSTHDLLEISPFGEIRDKWYHEIPTFSKLETRNNPSSEIEGKFQNKYNINNNTLKTNAKFQGVSNFTSTLSWPSFIKDRESINNKENV